MEREEGRECKGKDSSLAPDQTQIPMYVEPGVVLKLGFKLSTDILIKKGTTGMICRIHLMNEFILLL